MRDSTVVTDGTQRHATSRYDGAGLNAMEFTVRPVEVREILPLRELYRQEMNCQIIHDSLHGRDGWPRPYLIESDGDAAGYGSIAVGGPWAGTRTLFEFYVVEKQRSRFFEAFDALRAVSLADAIETQTNDVMLTAMLHTWAHDVASEKIIFEDRLTTAYRVPGAVLRKREPDGDWMLLEVGGEVAATGGVLYHYNRPYGDIWMEVAEAFRGRGFGTYLVQELKRICREGGNVPCARCNTDNVASRRTLQKAGFVPCAHILHGKL
jgi:GNAT superfamily N-acetyltransferase